jgi:hypothetical protein
MRKRGNSFIEFANSTPSINVPVIVEKTAILKLGGIEKFADELARVRFAEDLSRLKAIEATRQKDTIEENKKLHTSLVNFLNSIIETREIADNKDSRFLLHICNAYPNMTFTITNGKVIKGFGHIVEETEFAIRDLFEFLANSKNIKRIKKCPDCGNFYNQSKLYERQKYCPICSKKNHTPKDVQAKRTQVSRNAAKKLKDKGRRKALYEKEYKRLIKERHSMKDAKEYAEITVIEQLGEIE